MTLTEYNGHFSFVFFFFNKLPSVANSRVWNSFLLCFLQLTSPGSSSIHKYHLLLSLAHFHFYSTSFSWTTLFHWWFQFSPMCQWCLKMNHFPNLQQPTECPTHRFTRPDQHILLPLCPYPCTSHTGSSSCSSSFHQAKLMMTFSFLLFSIHKNKSSYSLNSRKEKIGYILAKGRSNHQNQF